MTLRMPAEWEKQAAIWLAFPHNRQDFPGKCDAVAWVYAEIIRAVTRSARVRLIVKDDRAQEKATRILMLSHVDMDRIDFIPAPTNRSWLRDSAPAFVYDGTERALIDWKFNAWAKYGNWKQDNNIPGKIADYLGVKRIVPRHQHRQVVMEGGAIEVNGKGSLVTTEECLLGDVQCRNPGFTRSDYEEIFARYLGISNTIWLESGIAGDDTHGHIDDITRFTNPTTLVTVVENNRNDDNYTPLQTNLKRLQKARDQDGKTFTVAELPMPAPILFDGQRLPASYANFLIVNDSVLVPVFGDANDRIALNVLTSLFPDHLVTGIYCRDFVLGLGTIHCASQQEPV